MASVMSDEIANWLRALGLEKYSLIFQEQDIDWRALPLLTGEDLRELGMSLGHRKILLDAVARLQASSADQVSDSNLDLRRAAVVRGGDQAERRRLSVFFCDMVGSTSLARTIDPEDMRRVLRDYQDRVAGAVSRYGGHLAQYLGDRMANDVRRSSGACRAGRP
jgi:class 3 adenylate cyclase